MPTLKDFVAALQAGWFPALASTVGCSIIVAGDYYDLPYLGSTPDWVVSIAVVVGVFSISVLIANIAYLPVVVWVAIKRRIEAKKFRKVVTTEVENASQEEKRVLAYLVTAGRKAFQAEINNPMLAPLVSKGFLIKLPGTHSMLAWPYIVQDDVWKHLVANQDRYRAKLPPKGHDPFHWRNTDF